jgi:hypothetical protein
MCLIKDGPFSPIRLFCHKYIETKRKSAKSDCVINSYIVKPVHVVTSIKQSPVLKGHLFLVLL